MGDSLDFEKDAGLRNVSQDGFEAAANTPKVQKVFGIEKGLYNTIILGLGFMSLFSAFSPTQSLQTNINKDLGYASLAVLYGCFAISNFFAPYFEKRLGPRASLLVGGSTYVLYVASCIHITTPTLLAASALVGIGASLLWLAEGDFITRNAGSQNIGLYSGIFFGLFGINNIIGNVTAGSLLNGGSSKSTLFIVLVILGCVGLAIFLLLRRTEPTTKSRVNGQEPNVLLSTFNMFKDTRLLCMVLIFVYSGYSQSYIYGKFPGSLPTNWVNYVSISLGVTAVLSSVITGKLSDKFGRTPVVLAVFVFEAIGIIGGYFLQSAPSDKFIFCSFLVAITFGIADSGLNTQMNAMISSTFKTEANGAFAAFKFVQSMGTCIGMYAGIYASINQTLITMGCVLLGSICSYHYLQVYTQRTAMMGAYEQAAISASAADEIDEEETPILMAE